MEKNRNINIVEKMKKENYYLTAIRYIKFVWYDGWLATSFLCILFQAFWNLIFSMFWVVCMKRHKCLYSSTPEEYTNWQKSLNWMLLYTSICWNLNAISRARGTSNVEWCIPTQFKCISYFDRRYGMQIHRKNLFLL